jgi:succinate dehydrogenase / fumarate reductase membrane anchor subunit
MGNGTNIGRVRALGSAHSGTHHWLVQRFTAIGNLVLGLWLVISLVWLGDYSYASLHGWAAKPLAATALALFVISAFWHARLGLQVLIEDYVHEHANKFACMALLNLAAFAGAGAGLFAIVRIALGAAA